MGGAIYLFIQKYRVLNLNCSRIHINKIGENRNLKRLLLSYFKCEKNRQNVEKAQYLNNN